MTDPRPPEERLAERLPARGAGATARTVLGEFAAIDRAVYRAAAATPTPTIDEPLRRLSAVADHSKLWLGVAAAIALAGGRTGRRAALTGIVAVGVNSAIVNLPMKAAGRRDRPDRDGAGVPSARWRPMPTSTSFPSGHAASAFAFTTAIGAELPALTVPLRVLAAAVAYSRVHTGVHYPGDVVVGSLVGVTVGEATARVSRAVRRRAEASG
jgi:undecaprenyl-diphosphatase